MAEASPLTSAHMHARRAVDEQRKIHWSQAAEQHQKASADFARTARITTDSEALRVLRLLEEEHRKLARIVKSYDTPQPSSPETASEETTPQPADTSTSATADVAQTKTEAPKPKSTSSALATSRTGSKARDSSPSLARDIASRRGIPPPGRSQPSAAAQARARLLTSDSRLGTNRSSGLPKIPPSIVESQSNIASATKSKKTADDDGFAKFYSNVTTGTMSRLSSALAFAGLPLSNEEPPTAQPTQRTVQASNEPDVKKIFSKAALDAVEDEHRQRGTFGHGFGPAESFYVVQKGGGTFSYADIARPQHGALAGIDEEDNDAFVDAREVPSSPVTKHSRGPSHHSRTSFGNARTHEELELENITLKQTLEQTAVRLSAFEAHAQDASMAALAQSMVSIRPDGGDRLRQLERQVAQQAEDQQKLEALVSKQKDTLKKYHAKWEEVKKSAKEKDRAKKEREREKAEKDGVADASAPVSI